MVRNQNKTGHGMGHKYTTCPPLGDFTSFEWLFNDKNMKNDVKS